MSQINDYSDIELVKQNEITRAKNTIKKMAIVLYEIHDLSCGKPITACECYEALEWKAYLKLSNSLSTGYSVSIDYYVKELN